MVLVGTTSGPDMLVARIRPRGALDTTFGGGDGYVTLDLTGAEIAYDVTVQPDGKIVVAGRSPRGLTVVRFLSDGSFDGDFGGVSGIVFVPVSLWREGQGRSGIVSKVTPMEGPTAAYETRCATRTTSCGSG